MLACLDQRRPSLRRWRFVVPLLALLSLAGLGACRTEIPVEVFVDGFEPENVRFEVETLGDRSQDELRELSRRGDVDGLLLLPPNACGGPCRAAIVSIFVHNHAGAEAPPVVRLKVPAGKAARSPIAFRGDEISQGRVGRIRWIVELWPEERSLIATVSASVKLVVTPPAAAGTAPSDLPMPTEGPPGERSPSP
ncbi:MAG: hypothetical protein IT383_17170 [Deltaproteobacteria bacterium]|nr:hypothetical protein [Deltaproteobacteria bacterium]